MNDPNHVLGEDYDVVVLYDGRTLHTHGPAGCAGAVCSIHNPTQHHMITWPQNWRWDRGIMERMCAHGIGHPDPDDHRIRTGLDIGVHGCDSCCTPPEKKNDA